MTGRGGARLLGGGWTEEEECEDWYELGMLIDLVYYRRKPEPPAARKQHQSHERTVARAVSSEHQAKDEKRRGSRTGSSDCSVEAGGWHRCYLAARDWHHQSEWHRETELWSSNTGRIRERSVGARTLPARSGSRRPFSRQDTSRRQAALSEALTGWRLHAQPAHYLPCDTSGQDLLAHESVREGRLWL